MYNYFRRETSMNLLYEAANYYLGEKVNTESEKPKRASLVSGGADGILGKKDVSMDNIGSKTKHNQLNIIISANPMRDDYHTGIRKVSDIKTLEEAISDKDWHDYEEFNPDYTKSMAIQAIESGTITVYSSYPIKQGVFVSPSRMEAASYSGNGKIYSKVVRTNDIAWLDPTQGQYASIEKPN